jgi:hypothetical protein
LIKNATANNVPVFLLDLKQVRSLATLEYFNKLDLFQQTSTEKNTFIPEYYPFEPNIYEQSGLPLLINHYNLPRSALAFYATAPGSSSDLPSLIFTPSDQEKVTVQQDKYTRLIKLPMSDNSHNNELDRFGFSSQGEAKILSGLNQSSHQPIIVLGGSLPDSPLADSLASPRSMSYLNTHPWINLLDYYQLATWTGTGAISPSWNDADNQTDCSKSAPTEVTDQSSAYNALSCAHSNIMTTLAWNAYAYLSSQTLSEQEKTLRSFYYANIDRLLLASSWLDQPEKLSKNLSRTTTNYYLFADDQNFLLFDETGGKLVLALSNGAQEPLEWIAPTSQSAVGLSDSSTWTDKNEAGDPAVIQGAFIDNTFGDKKYEVKTIPSGVEFSLPSAGIKKTFLLAQNELIVNYTTPSPITTTIPFILSPYRFLQSGLADEMTQLRLQQKNGDAIPPYITGNFRLISANWFYDSFEMLATSEDPNKEYPTGHYLPFPVGLLKFEIESGTENQMRIAIGAIKP